MPKEIESRNDFKVTNESGRMTEREVREHNERSAGWMKNLAEVNGQSVTHDQMLRKAQEFSEKAHKEGKI